MEFPYERQLINTYKLLLELGVQINLLWKQLNYIIKEI